MGGEENSSSEGVEPLPWASVRSPAQLGGFLRVARERRNLSQAALAELIGVDRRYVYQLESGEPTLYARRLFALLRELGVDVEVRLRRPGEGGGSTGAPRPEQGEQPPSGTGSSGRFPPGQE